MTSIGVRIACISLALSACAGPRARGPATDANDRNCAFNTGDRANLRRALAAAPDDELVRSTRSGLVLVVVDSAAAREATFALVRLVGPDAVLRATDGSGSVRMLLRAAGSYQLIVRHIGFRSTRDTISVRAGYQDTLVVGLHAGRQCLSRVVTW